MESNQGLNGLLHPSRFDGMSGKMAAIVGYILDQEFTDPSIDDMCITSDGMVLAQHKGDCGMNDFIGAESDLKRNWSRLLTAAGLTEDQRKAAEQLYGERITDWRD